MFSLLRRFEQYLKHILRSFLRILLHSSRSPHLDPGSIRRILVVRQHNQLGDMLCVVPLLRSLRSRFPNCQIGLIASPVNVDVMANNAYVDRVINFDKREFLGKHSLKLQRLIAFIRQLRDSGFDLVIVPSTVSTSFTSDLLAFLSGARYRIGAGGIDGLENPSSFFFNIPVHLDWRSTPHRHQTLRNLDIATSLSLEIDVLSSEITLTRQERERAKAVAGRTKGEKSTIVALHPGAGKTPNRWPAERFAAVANSLHQSVNAAVLITAGPMDGEPVAALKTGINGPCDLIDNKPIREVAAILSHVDLVISNDTGIMHVAGAVGTPVLSLFGPTDPEQWAPKGPRHRFIRGNKGEIDAISVEEVFRNAQEMLMAR